MTAATRWASSSANVAFALERDDLSDSFREALKKILATHGGL